MHLNRPLPYASQVTYEHNLVARLNKTKNSARAVCTPVSAPDQKQESRVQILLSYKAHLDDQKPLYLPTSQGYYEGKSGEKRPLHSMSLRGPRRKGKII